MKNLTVLVNKLNETIDSIKADILEYWSDLTKENLDNVADYDSLVTQLQAVYSYSILEAEIEIMKFMEKMGLVPMEIYLEQLKQALYQSTSAATVNLTRVLERSVEKLKDSSGEFQKALVEYVKAHPLKAVSLSVIGGILLHKIAKKIL